jgi:hypothetical protein
VKFITFKSEIIFRIINKAFPEVAQNIYAWGGGSEISMPIATLIIFFPLFILLSYFVNKIYIENPTKKDLGIRKWLTYITLFVAGLLLAGDLVTVIYKFLDGQDLTLAFLLKALAVLLVAGAIFAHYLQDIRGKVSFKCMRTRPIVVAVVILATIIWGFVVMGSPQSQRLIRLDNQKIYDLQNLQYQVINYWQVNGSIPEKWEGMMLDVQTQKPYEYKKTGAIMFELCAEFNKAGMMNQNQYPTMMRATYPDKVGAVQNDNWNHQMGRQCFEKTIDPIAYPTQVRG